MDLKGGGDSTTGNGVLVGRDSTAKSSILDMGENEHKATPSRAY
jgi:hypothetical protein